MSDIIVDRYRMISKIGSGGTADVYLAFDEKLNRQVAIKILSRIYASERNFVARFKKEAQILANLNDPNIVAIYDWGQYDSSYFICMEYVEGQSLEEIIDKQGIISPSVTAKYAIQICNALEVAHKNNLIHRDIKPQNILVTPDGTIKITDFGIAKSLIEDTTKTINILGTAYYISPEQAQGKILSYSTDIYSLGVVLYEMLTADLPFRGDNSIEISLKHINEKPIKPSLLVSSIPLQIEKIVMHCLEKDPRKRYDSVSSIKADLKNFLYRKPLIIDKKKEGSENLDKKSSIDKLFFLKRRSKNFNENYSVTYDSIDEAPAKSKKKSKFNFIINLSASYTLAAIFLILFVIFAINYNSLKTKQNIIKVPHVENMLLDNAKEAAAFYRLDIKKKSDSYDDSIPENYIISQNPEAGSEVSEGSSIEVTLSKGKQPSIFTIVPNVIGLNIADATKIINDLGLKITQTQKEYSDFFEEEIVIYQDPSFGSEVKTGENIKLKISLGQNILMIPNIIGYDYSYVASQLASMGLNVIINKIPNVDYQPGKVLKISPEVGTRVKEGDIVNIYIATTEQMIQMPDVTQLSVDKAVSILQSLSISYDISNVEAQFDIQKSLVISQYPSPNTFISIGEKAILIVGQ
ncbi:MAG: Stk1 family PASTA domain-containing Ser/Thr kinase [Actinomycetota bacterium]|nr:Stk1 family PASTA domain-containing Ser/Thr kinase [Actinomycetota bacterium]